MSISNVLAAHFVNNLEDLIAALHTLRVNGKLFDVSDSSVITFGREGKPLRIRLIEDKLTDGSKVYNINIE